MNYLRLCFIFLSSSVLVADWNPDLSQTEVPAFKQLKEAVSSKLNEKWCTKDKSNLLMDLVLTTRPQVCVEIGVFSGSSLMSTAAALKYLDDGKVYAIDPWSNAVAIRHMGAGDPHRGWWAKVDMQRVYTYFQNKLEHFGLQSFVKVIREPSDKAISHIDEDIDFLHLDGEYNIYAAKKETDNYLAKVKSGGYILLSNVLHMTGGRQPKLAAFKVLYNKCEYITDVDNGNSVLFRKK